LKSTLLDAIAHEFKTPLTSIKAAASGLLTLIGKKATNAPERELASIVEEEADRLNVLVTETIRMARVEAGKVRMERKPVDPEDVVRSALAQLGSRAEDRSVTIHSDSSLHAVPARSRAIRDRNPPGVGQCPEILRRQSAGRSLAAASRTRSSW